jgi:hypothetical protein
LKKKIDVDTASTASARMIRASMMPVGPFLSSRHKHSLGGDGTLPVGWLSQQKKKKIEHDAGTWIISPAI